MEKIQELLAIIRKIIREQDEKVLNVRGGRGYSVGHPYPANPGPRVNQDLGSPGPYEFNDEDVENEKTVRISKAFKKE